MDVSLVDQERMALGVKLPADRTLVACPSVDSLVSVPGALLHYLPQSSSSLITITTGAGTAIKGRNMPNEKFA